MKGPYPEQLYTILELGALSPEEILALVGSQMALDKPKRVD